jgi:hypothetical protein
VFAALATSLRRLCPVVLEIAAGFGGSLAVFGKVAGPATVLRPIVHIVFLSAGLRPASRRAIAKPTSTLSLGFSLSGTIRMKYSGS